MDTPAVIRVAEAGKPAFLLRKGEEGLSVFDPQAVDPPLTEAEIFGAFRPGSVLLVRSAAAVQSKGLQLVPVEGEAILPDRLRQAHREIRAGTGVDRAAFKKALRELE